MKHSKILKHVADYYTEKVAEHGSTHWGVDWNSTESQVLRFDQLLQVLRDNHDGSVLDYGCGYGAMARVLREREYSGHYFGYDISEAMISAAKEQLADLPNCTLFSELDENLRADYTIASGIFNVKQGTDKQEWETYIIDTIALMAAHSAKGFAFNMLTGYSDADRMRPDLYYGDPGWYIDHCIRTYSRHVAMLHNYGLYEFTILVNFA
jgi:SAM-dependent methyltransferase